MTDPTRHRDTDLERCLTAALELLDEGLEPPLEQICHGDELLIEAVREALAISRDLPGLQRGRAGRDELSGRVLAGRYLLERRLGAGAMGVVYAARDTELAREVAVKALRSSALAQGEAAARFAREAEALASASHPSVVAIFDRGATEDGGRFLVMELLEGAPLGEVLEEGARLGARDPLADSDWAARSIGAEFLHERNFVRAAASWAADLAAGLGAAHARGVLHRDVKPSNVFLRADGRPVLLGFGLATRGASSSLTRTDAVLGNWGWSDPQPVAVPSELRLSAGDEVDALGINAMTGSLIFSTERRPGSTLAQLRTLVRDPQGGAHVNDLKYPGGGAVGPKLKLTIEDDIDSICGLDPEPGAYSYWLGTPADHGPPANSLSLSLAAGRDPASFLDSVVLQVSGWGSATPSDGIVFVEAGLFDPSAPFGPTNPQFTLLDTFPRSMSEERIERTYSYIAPDPLGIHVGVRARFRGAEEVATSWISILRR